MNAFIHSFKEIAQLWHSAPPGMAVGCCELRLRSTPRYRLVSICFPPPGFAAAAAKILVGSSSVAVKPQFKYVGSIVQADGGQDREL